MTTTRALLWNILLALIWAVATEKLSLANLAIGFGLGYVILLYAQRAVGKSDYFRKTRQLLGLALFFLWEIILSNLRIAYYVLTPSLHVRPGVIGIPLDTQDTTVVSLLAGLLTLTPGTLSLDISRDRKVLYIHALFVDDRDELERRIKDTFERRLLELLQ